MNDECAIASAFRIQRSSFIVHRYWFERAVRLEPAIADLRLPIGDWFFFSQVECGYGFY